MDVEVNLLAVVLAALSTLIVGSVWYTPKVFGNTWIKLAKLDKKNMANPKVAIPLAVIVSLFTAYVLAHVAFLSNQFFKNSFLQDSLTTAFWLWLGFASARIITHDLFENRPDKLTLITIGHELVAIMTMGMIIGLLGT
jgi:hypothetical protein